MQIDKGATVTRQLLLDSPTRWSSTYVMLERAESLKEASTTYILLLFYVSYAVSLQVIPKFVYEIAYAESDRERRNKLLQLDLTERAG